MERRKVEDAFGASKKPAIQLTRRLLAWFSKLDMNVILICHQKSQWKDGKEVGVTFDGWDKLEYELHLASEKIYHYFWHTFADKIIEQEKENLKGADEAKKAGSYALLEYILVDSLKLLHPFMPFITEEIWQKLQLLAEEDIVLVAIESPDLVGIKAPDLPAMLGPDNRAGRRGHRHGKDYWKPQRPANNNSRK